MSSTWLRCRAFAALAVVFGLLHGNHIEAAGCKVYKARYGQCGGKKGVDAPLPGNCCAAGLVCTRLSATFWRCDFKPVPKPSPASGFPKPRLPYNYKDLIAKSLLFYEAQRSGPLPPTNRIPWRASSFTQDVTPLGTIIRGGWFDAGDHVKFVFPAAWTLTVLAWEIIEFRKGFAASGQLPYALDNLRWGAEFLMHCRLNENITIAQVGNGGADHVVWNRPENITTPYPVYTINTTAPGSDLTGTMAAALAAVSIVFNATDPGYSAKCLSHARRLYKFSRTYLGKYSTSVPQAAGFYPSYSFYDDIAWGAIFLHLATGEASFKREAALYLDKNMQLEGGLSKDWQDFGYDNAAWGACLLLAKTTGNATYIAKIQGFITSWIQGTADKPTYTPRRFAWFAQWGSAQATMNAGFIMAVYAKSRLATPEQRLRLNCFGHKMVGYILGDTGRSFVVGYGVNPPCRYHHRAASCGNFSEPCDWNDYAKPTCNPHVLTGALVGGPLKNDSYKDARNDYVQNEVAINYNAGYTGVLASLVQAPITRLQCDFGGLSTFPYRGPLF